MTRRTVSLDHIATPLTIITGDQCHPGENNANFAFIRVLHYNVKVLKSRFLVNILYEKFIAILDFLLENVYTYTSIVEVNSNLSLHVHSAGPRASQVNIHALQVHNQRLVVTPERPRESRKRSGEGRNLLRG